MIKKSNMFRAFQLYKANIKQQMGRSIKCVHHDKGGEYMSKDFLDFCKLEGIRLKFMNTATLQQNSVAEHLNRTIKGSCHLYAC